MKTVLDRRKVPMDSLYESGIELSESTTVKTHRRLLAAEIAKTTFPEIENGLQLAFRKVSDTITEYTVAVVSIFCLFSGECNHHDVTVSKALRRLPEGYEIVATQCLHFRPLQN
jgi:hypothetical protein